MSTPSELAIEQELKSKGLIAPRVTPEDVDAAILTAQYYIFPGTTLTVCCLTLQNGFTVSGESAAASPENFDEEIGRKLAFSAARNKIWSYLGFELRTRLQATKE